MSFNITDATPQEQAEIDLFFAVKRCLLLDVDPHKILQIVKEEIRL